MKLIKTLFFLTTLTLLTLSNTAAANDFKDHTFAQIADTKQVVMVRKPKTNEEGIKGYLVASWSKDESKFENFFVDAKKLEEIDEEEWADLYFTFGEYFFSIKRNKYNRKHLNNHMVSCYSFAAKLGHEKGMEKLVELYFDDTVETKGEIVGKVFYGFATSVLKKDGEFFYFHDTTFSLDHDAKTATPVIFC